MLDVRVVIDDVPEYIFKACGAQTQDERDTISACVRTYARDCIRATLLTIEDGPVFKDAWRYRVMVENGVVPDDWNYEISCAREGFRQRADEAFDRFVSEELADYEYDGTVRPNAKGQRGDACGARLGQVADAQGLTTHTKPGPQARAL